MTWASPRTSRPRSSGPFVVATLPADAVRALSRDDRVAFVGSPASATSPTTRRSRRACRPRGRRVVHGTGVRGAGIRIAILESGTPDISTSCFNIAATQDASQSADNHMTKSIGIIGNRYADGKCGGDWQGYAPEADVYLANAATTSTGTSGRARGTSTSSP